MGSAMSPPYPPAAREDVERVQAIIASLPRPQAVLHIARILKVGYPTSSNLLGGGDLSLKFEAGPEFTQLWLERALHDHLHGWCYDANDRYNGGIKSHAPPPNRELVLDALAQRLADVLLHLAREHPERLARLHGATIHRWRNARVIKFGVSDAAGASLSPYPAVGA